jgi:hypothetical protein
MAANPEEPVLVSEEEAEQKLPTKKPGFSEIQKKAWEARRQQGTITRARKAEEKAKRAEEYKRALEVLNGPTKKDETAKEEPEKEEPDKTVVKPDKPPRKTRTKIIELTDSSSSSSSSDSDSDESIEVVKVVRRPKKTVVPDKKKKKRRKVVEESDESEDEQEDTRRLGGAVARDLLQRRVLQRAADEAIRRLVPNYKGSL